MSALHCSSFLRKPIPDVNRALMQVNAMDFEACQKPDGFLSNHGHLTQIEDNVFVCSFVRQGILYLHEVLRL